MINYDISYSEVAQEHLLKIFYRRTNKKEYEMQNLEHDICYTNVIVIQNVILIAKVPFGGVKKKELVIDKSDIEVKRVYNATNPSLKYNCYLDLADNKVAVVLKLWNIKKS